MGGATRRLREGSRARRFKTDVNHRIAKAIVEPDFLIGREDLTHLCERTRAQGKHLHRKRAPEAFAERGAFVACQSQIAGGLTLPPSIL